MAKKKVTKKKVKRVYKRKIKTKVERYHKFLIQDPYWYETNCYLDDKGNTTDGRPYKGFDANKVKVENNYIDVEVKA